LADDDDDDDDADVNLLARDVVLVFAAAAAAAAARVGVGVLFSVTMGWSSSTSVAGYSCSVLHTSSTSSLLQASLFSKSLYVKTRTPDA